MPKTLDMTRILREQKEQLRAGFQDRLVMTASISLRVNNIDIISLNNIIVNSFFEKNKKIRISDFFIEIFINRYVLLVFCIVPALFLEFW